MNSSIVIRTFTAMAFVTLVAGCAGMSRTEKGTAIGATTGGVAGAVVAGPIGAAVGAGVGGYVGHEGTEPGRATTGRSGPGIASHDPSVVRSVQQSLNERGYNAGPVDGQWGPSTEGAVREFQQANGLAQTGDINAQTLSALGVSR
jgi:phage tail tape-measure protein